jgi:hypothetical protein
VLDQLDLSVKDVERWDGQLQRQAKFERRGDGAAAPAEGTTSTAD